MVIKASGLTKKWNPSKPIIGYSDAETVKLDFDNINFKDVKYWSRRIVKWFKLEGFVILRSSKNNYHVVFNRPVSWSKNMHVVSWASLVSNNKGLLKWFQMQCIKESSTLRVSTKGEKHSPKLFIDLANKEEKSRIFWIIEI